MNANQPLSCEVEGDELVIRIGIDVLADAQEQREPFYSWSEEARDFVQVWKVIDNREWAKDVVRVITNEEEDGSSPLTNLLDKAMVDALDDGSIAVWGPELGISEEEARECLRT